jgi:hypothetical protein
MKLSRVSFVAASIAVATMLPSAPGAASTTSAWSGRYDLYRPGVFSTQRTMTWCVAASIQMMLNIVRGESDQSRENQKRYISYARKHDRYKNPEITGTDGQGWVAALRHFGELYNYDIVGSPSYKDAIRSSVRRLRATDQPVGLVIVHHFHAWVMTGFETTTDPKHDPGFEIRAIYVMGSLYPRPQQDNGLDPPPDTRISRRELRKYLTDYRDPLKPHNPWEGKYVTIQP